MANTTFASFPRLIEATAETFAGRTFLPRRHGRGGPALTFSAIAEEARDCAAGLITRGIQHGDRVGLISENRAEWLTVDFACASIGAVDVPRGVDTSPLELLFILRHARCRFAFAETEVTAKIILGLRDELPNLEGVCVMTGPCTLDDAITLEDLVKSGQAALREQPDLVEDRSAAIKPDDLLTIVYTSGTTADPKGVMLTHANLLSNVDTVREVLHFDHEDVFLSVLPAWHAYERLLDYVAFRSGAQLVYTDRRKIKEDLLAVKPTVFAAVPRIWESVHDGIAAACRKKRKPMAWLLSRVLDACRAVGESTPTLRQRTLHRLAQRSILPKFRNATGGRMRIAVSGGGALPRHVDARLLGIGIPLVNGYGLTETSPVAAVRTPEDNRPGTIGRPLPQTSIEVRSEEGGVLPQGESGLIWIRGPQVMRGYYENEARTAGVLQDGWFNSGDLGCIDPDGHVQITGRAKDTIVLAGGENVEPEHIEAALKTSEFIDQAVVLGQDRKTLGAIIIPHLDCLETAVPRGDWDERDGVLHSDAVKRFFRQEIDRLLTSANGFRPLEKVATFRVLLETLSIENGLLTQTLKVKRHKVVEQHAGVIDQMW